MKRLLSALAVMLVVATPACAQNDKQMPSAPAAKIEVDQPWARASAGRSRTGAAYFTIKNAGTEGDRLVSASSDVAARAELHTHIHDNGIMRMRHLEDGVEVPAGGEVVFKPGSLHVMMIGLKDQLVAGSSFRLTLMFEKSGSVTVTVPIESIGAMGPSRDLHDHDHYMPMPGMPPHKDM